MKIYTNYYFGSYCNLERQYITDCDGNTQIDEQDAIAVAGTLIYEHNYEYAFTTVIDLKTGEMQKIDLENDIEEYLKEYREEIESDRKDYEELCKSHYR